jgi:predicted DNA-binding transcriptional regulator AlpA
MIALKPDTPAPQFIRVQGLSALLGISRTTIWRWEKEGHLPPARIIGGGETRPIHGWLRSEINEWLNSTPIR